MEEGAPSPEHDGLEMKKPCNLERKRVQISAPGCARRVHGTHRGSKSRAAWWASFSFLGLTRRAVLRQRERGAKAMQSEKFGHAPPVPSSEARHPECAPARQCGQASRATACATDATTEIGFCVAAHACSRSSATSHASAASARDLDSWGQCPFENLDPRCMNAAWTRGRRPALRPRQGFPRVSAGREPTLCGLLRSCAPTTFGPFAAASHTQWLPSCPHAHGANMQRQWWCPHLSRHKGNTTFATALHCKPWLPGGVPRVPQHDHGACAAVLSQHEALLSTSCVLPANLGPCQ